MLHQPLNIETHNISDDEKREIKQSNGLLPNVAKGNPNVRFHFRIYFNFSDKARLYFFCKMKEWVKKTIKRKK